MFKMHLILNVLTCNVLEKDPEPLDLRVADSRSIVVCY